MAVKIFSSEKVFYHHSLTSAEIRHVAIDRDILWVGSPVFNYLTTDTLGRSLIRATQNRAPGHGTD